MAIQRLNQGSLKASSQFPFYDDANGSDARASITALAELMAQLLGTANLQLTQYAAPTATGQTVAVTPQTKGASVWLIITPLASYGAMILLLPPVSECQHGQEILVTCTQNIGSVTTNGNGASIVGGITTLVAQGAQRIKFDAVLKTWYRAS